MKKNLNVKYNKSFSAIHRVVVATIFIIAGIEGVDAQVVVNGNVFGGGNAAGVTGTATVNIESGTVDTAVYGGCNSTGTVSGAVTVNINGGTIGIGDPANRVFGGGFGEPTATGANVTVNVGNDAGDATPSVNGHVYGGSALGQVNASTSNTTTVNIKSGTVAGSIYGGGLGRKADNSVEPAITAVEALVNGNAAVNIGTGEQNENNVTISGYVFGANNVNGTPKGNVTVDVWKTAHNSNNSVPNITTAAQLMALSHDASNFALQAVYGGGNEADYKPTSGYNTSVHIHNCDNTVKMVYGGGRAAAVGTSDINANATTTVDGGRIDTLFSGGDGHTTDDEGNYRPANIYGNAQGYVHGGFYSAVFAGSNTSGTISGNMGVSIDKTGDCASQEEIIGTLFGGGNLADLEGDVTLNIMCGDIKFNEIYGGCNLANLTGNVTLNLYGGTADYVYGGSKGRAADAENSITAKAADIDGDVTLNLYGGTVTNAFGGSNIYGNITGNIVVNVEDAENATCPLTVTNVYGAGNLTPYTPTDPNAASPQVNIKHIKSGSSISGNVYGGGFGPSAIVTSNPVVTIGDLTEGHESYIATVAGDVYGGGDAAAVTGNTTVLLQKSNSTVGKLFGGGNAAGVSGTASVTMTNGSVVSGIYGGCNSEGDVTGNITVSVTGGAVGASGEGNEANIHGGGYGASTTTSGDVAVTINGDAVNVYGDVYGGSALGSINSDNSDNTTVTLTSGTVHGDIYGGGLGDETHAAAVNGAVQVTVNGGTVDNVYGCNNVNGAPQSTVNVDIYGTDQPESGYAIDAVYGGGNQAAYTGSPVVEVHNCNNKIEYVYGGGNQAAVAGTDVTIYGGNTIGYVFGGGNQADVTTSGTNVKIYGGTIGYVFGGNNNSGTVTGNMAVNIDKQTEEGHSSCDMKIGEVYGGGNFAAGNAGTITVGCTGTLVALGEGEHYGVDKEGIGTVYGGANQADISNNIVLNINSGIVENVFGGNNTSGTISGTITVNINKDNNASCASDWYVGNVYGAGNQAAYNAPAGSLSYPAVNILNGAVSGDVFGGGLGNTAVVTGNPQVIVNGSGASVAGGVYGGGSQAATTGDPVVTLTTGSLANVYGGGKAANVTGAPTVNINGGTVSTGVYGGCNASGNVSGDITVSLTGGTVGTSVNPSEGVYGGGFGSATTTTGDVTVTLGSTAEVYGDLYGGSALGAVGASGKTTTVNLQNDLLHGTLFGGGKGQTSGVGGAIAAVTNGDVEVNVTAANTNGNLLGVYGGANEKGNVVGDIAVNIDANVGASGNGNSVDIFGGGLGENTTTGGDVTVTVGNSTTPTIYGDIYGGSALGEVGATGTIAKVDFQNGTLNGSIYGGGMGQNSSSTSAIVTGGTEVAISGGSITGSIYGGCNERGNVVEDITVNVNGGTIGTNSVSASVFGGGYGANTTTQGDVEVNINGASVTVWGDVYGGSCFCDVNSDGNDATTVNILNGEVKQDVFGGGLGSTSPNYAAVVAGVVTVNIGSDNGDGTNSGNAKTGRCV